LRSVILQVPPYQIRIFPLFRLLKYPILSLTNLLYILSFGKNIMFNKPKIQKSYYKEFIQVDFFDPIRVYFLTAMDLITTTKLICDFPNEVENITVPTLILEGTADSLCDPVGAHQMYKKIKNQKKKLIIYRGAEHSLFNDVNSKKIYEDIYNWILSFD
jgi:pimeloyl-ACP methyl ester carboxylesterase